MRTSLLDAASTGLFASLIPGVTVTEIERTPAGLLLTALALAQRAICPRCETASSRIHSYYTRRPHDLPMCGLPIRLLLHVRRFRCLNPTCPARTFSERLPLLVTSAAQRTVRLNDALRDLALALAVRLELAKALEVQCLRAETRFSGELTVRPLPPSQPLACSVSTTSLFAKAKSSAPFSPTAKAIRLLTFSPTELPKPLRPGCRSIRALRSSPVIARQITGERSA